MKWLASVMTSMQRQFLKREDSIQQSYSINAHQMDIEPGEIPMCLNECQGFKVGQQRRVHGDGLSAGPTRSTNVQRSGEGNRRDEKATRSRRSLIWLEMVVVVMIFTMHQDGRYTAVSACGGLLRG